MNVSKTLRRPWSPTARASWQPTRVRPRSRSASTRSAWNSTADNRRDYREMFFRADEAMRKYVSGVILYDETLRQKAANGTPLVDIIKATGVGAGHQGRRRREAVGRAIRARRSPKASMACANDSPNITSSARASPNGAASSRSPTSCRRWGAVKQNAQALARYAALCQEAGIVPIVEPEVLMDGEPGDHSIERCHEVTEWVLQHRVQRTSRCSRQPRRHGAEAQHGDRRQERPAPLRRKRWRKRRSTF